MAAKAEGAGGGVRLAGEGKRTKVTGEAEVAAESGDDGGEGGEGEARFVPQQLGGGSCR